MNEMFPTTFPYEESSPPESILGRTQSDNTCSSNPRTAVREPDSAASHCRRKLPHAAAAAAISVALNMLNCGGSSDVDSGESWSRLLKCIKSGQSGEVGLKEKREKYKNSRQVDSRREDEEARDFDLEVNKVEQLNS
ncbi:hypothetical protein GCK72_010671 [Caenorhabditis remanei]|uniref:Uncharacterized protein n=1 Tax=Caenorhabditis remanei TaxID=31234 RepID=A0A6A5H5U2_CAERE|nr:hypothetical protein GCK72_010671 [Caenorhabditis remanei]KAF1762409.1 hypothetical protein GCK72_010671 [Caenorhabditis remanei]